MRKVVSSKSEGSPSPRTIDKNAHLAFQPGADVICLETYRLTRMPVELPLGPSVCITAADRGVMLAAICRRAAVGGHAGMEWAKVADFLARHFQSNPIR